MTDDTNKDQPLAEPQEAPAMEDPPKAIESSSEGNGAGRKSTAIAFSIWPPTQRTRDAIIARLMETLSSTSVLSKRYGVIPADEASDVAKEIESQAFGTANATNSPTDDDGIEILQVYSKEISRRMIEAVKSRSASAAPTATGATLIPKEEEAADASVEEEERKMQTLKVDSSEV